jgi:hypothetical protein
VLACLFALLIAYKLAYPPAYVHTFPPFIYQILQISVIQKSSLSLCINVVFVCCAVASFDAELSGYETK